MGATATLAAWNDAEVGTGSFSASVFVSEAKDTASASYAQTSDVAPAALTFAVAGLSPSGTATAGLDVRTTAATTVDGQAVADLDDMLSLLEARQIGEKVVLTVWRIGQTRKVAATLGSSD